MTPGVPRLDGPYPVPFNAEQVMALEARIAALTDAGNALAAELARWGWGDFHYGSTGQERSVTDPIAAWRALVGEA